MQRKLEEEELAKKNLPFTCKGWKQTAGCDPDGSREKKKDKGCDDEIEGAL